MIKLGIDPLLDMARTFVNLGGNRLAVATLNRLDDDRPGLVGFTSGANVAAALRPARKATPPDDWPQ